MMNPKQLIIIRPLLRNRLQATDLMAVTPHTWSALITVLQWLEELENFVRGTEH